jgi:hypothetical protein
MMEGVSTPFLILARPNWSCQNLKIFLRVGMLRKMVIPAIRKGSVIWKKFGTTFLPSCIHSSLPCNKQEAFNCQGKKDGRRDIRNPVEIPWNTPVLASIAFVDHTGAYLARSTFGLQRQFTGGIVQRRSVSVEHGWLDFWPNNFGYIDCGPASPG